MMEQNAAQNHTETLPISVRTLAEDFKIFTEASNKLQAKYDLLAKETQALRKQLALKEEEIKRSESLVMLGKTAAGIAHEIRNPLGAIKLFLSILKDEVKDRPVALELLEQIEQGTITIDNVITNILHFAKNNQLLLSPVNMHHLIQDELELVKAARPNSAVFEVNLGGNPYINGHESSLKQVVGNLVLNALQATCDAGHIRIDFYDSSDGGAVLQIADDGEGIPEDVMDKIFDPFVSTKNEGTGLGLAIVKRIVEQHGANVSVSNAGGACFKIQFPR